MRVGQRILGVIKTVNDFDLVISLPNQLTGFVACDRISPHLTRLFSQAVVTEDGTNEKGLDAQAAGLLPSLKDYYAVGEIVVGSIVAVEAPPIKATFSQKDIKTKKEAARKGRKRLELSLLPSVINSSYLGESTVVMGTLMSREDRGFIVDLSVTSSDGEVVVGFISDRDISSGSSWRVGKTATFMITSTYEQGKSRVVSLTCNPSVLAQGTTSRTKLPIEALCCGLLVTAEVVNPTTKAMASTPAKGPIAVKFSGQHEGRIDILNLPEAIVWRRNREVDLNEHFPPGKKVVARIIHMDKEEKLFHLTMLQSILNWCPVIPPLSNELGRKVEACPILRIDPGLGVLIGGISPNDEEKQQHNPNSFAYVHISRLSDEHVDRIEAPYKVGSKHDARILDWDAFSGLFSASLQNSIWRETFLRSNDVHVGQVVRGQVMRIEPWGLLVALGERVRAICPRAQIAELVTDEKMLQSAYHVGQKYKFRVLEVDSTANNRIILTRKKGLIDTTLPILSLFEMAQPGNYHDGHIVALKPFGALIKFFGEVKGLVPVSEMADEYVEQPQESYFMGQVVRCRVIKCGWRSNKKGETTDERELVLSFRKGTGPKKLPPELVKSKKRPVPSTKNEEGEVDAKRLTPTIAA